MAAVTLAGCGGHTNRAVPEPPPKLDRALAQRLAALSDSVASHLDARDACGALRLAKRAQRQTIASINAGRVPAPMQETLASATTRLVARIHCKR